MQYERLLSELIYNIMINKRLVTIETIQIDIARYVKMKVASLIKDAFYLYSYENLFDFPIRKA